MGIGWGGGHNLGANLNPSLLKLYNSLNIFNKIEKQAENEKHQELSQRETNGEREMRKRTGIRTGIGKGKEKE